MYYQHEPHYFAERVDRVLETREKFRELYRSYTPLERSVLLMEVTFCAEPTILAVVSSETDSAIVNPSDEEIDMIWWELVKNGFREFVYAKEIPNGIAAMTRKFLSGKTEFSMPCMSATVDSVLNNPEKYRCDERKDRNRKCGNSKKK